MKIEEDIEHGIDHISFDLWKKTPYDIL